MLAGGNAADPVEYEQVIVGPVMGEGMVANLPLAVSSYNMVVDWTGKDPTAKGGDFVLRKAFLIVVVLCLVAQIAVAAGPVPRRVTPAQPVRYALKVFVENMRERLVINPNREVAAMIRHANERILELEALSESDPEAFKEALLARHDRLVLRATEVIANRDSLPEKLVTDLAAAQLRALEIASAKAMNAKDPAIAEKRLGLLKARQELVLAMFEKNAERIAKNQILRAETILANAEGLRTRIEKGEGLDVIKEQRARIMKNAHERRMAWLKSQQGSK